MKGQRLLAFALIVLASAGLALLARTVGGLTGVDALRYKTLDWRQATTVESFQLGRGERESPITIVFFDEASIRDPFEGWAWEQPFPRAEIARVIDAVASAGARTIGLDVHLEDRYPRLNEIDGGDDYLVEVMTRAANVVLVAPVEDTPEGPVLGSVHPDFMAAAAGVSAAETPTAFETIREMPLAVRSGEGLAPSFGLALYAHYRGLDVDSLLNASWDAGRVSLPGLPEGVGEISESWLDGTADPAEKVLPFTVRFLGPPSSPDAEAPPGTFTAVSSGFVQDAALFFPEFFDDKIVLIGSGFHDSDKFRTAFFGTEPPADSTHQWSDYSYMYGVEIHANSVQNMLDEEYVRPMGAGARFLVLLLAAAVAGGLTFQRGAAWGGAGTVITVAALFAIAMWTWAGQVFGPGGTYFTLGDRFLWFPFVSAGLSAVLAYVSSVAYVSIVEGREKRFIKGAFGKYVSPEVVADIAQNPDMLQLGGEKRPLTLLFSDLAGFTTLSERMDPQDLLALLNEYLDDMTEIVMEEKGTLDKYIGDAIMAFWNAPKEVEDHADRALRAAVLMQRRMHELNAKWREDDPGADELVVRIGVNTGTVVVGNVGGEARFDYSAIGDAVNLAARLEPANKTYDTLTMVSQFTLDHATPDAFRVRELDLIAVKGKSEPVTVYEVLEMEGTELDPHREQAVELYQRGLTAYKNREWSLAAECFGAALEADPADGPAAVYLERATEFISEPPPPDWDFVVRRTQK